MASETCEHLYNTAHFALCQCSPSLTAAPGHKAPSRARGLYQKHCSSNSSCNKHMKLQFSDYLLCGDSTYMETFLSYLVFKCIIV